jgi:uncharacterized protein
VQFSALETANLHFYAPRYAVLAGGVDLARQGAEIVSLSVDEALDGASRASFTVLDGLTWLSGPVLAPGTELEVKLGYAEPLPTLFVGEVSELRPTFPAEGASQLDVAALDFSHRLSRGCRFRPWENVTDSDIAQQIATDENLSPSGVEATTVVYPKIMQDGETNLEFLRNRAQRNNFEVGVRGRTLIFATPEDQASAPEVTTLKWGESLISFTPELNTAGQVSQVTVRGWNPSAKREIVGRASWRDVWGNLADRRSGGEIVERLYGTVEACVRNEPVYTQQEADRRAQAILRQQADALIKGRGESIGIPQIRARTTLVLDGLGPFSLRYYVTNTTHSLSVGGYRTTFTVKSDTYARSR